MMEIRKSIALVGMPGAGKSTVGRALQRTVDAKLLDSDTEIQSRTGREVFDIFSQYGEVYFRQLELRTIETLLSAKPIILSTGGGAYIQAKTRKIIEENATSIWLKVGFEDLWNRVRNQQHRPLLCGMKAKEKLQQQFKDRTPIYAKARVTIDCTSQSAQQVACSVLAHLHACSIVKAVKKDGENRL